MPPQEPQAPSNKPAIGQSSGSGSSSLPPPPASCCPACRAASLSQPPRAATTWERIFAWGLSKVIPTYNASAGPIKQELFAQLATHLQAQPQQLRVLEVGLGTAPNLEMLAQALQAVGGQGLTGQLQVVGVDKNPAMWPYARQAVQAAGLREEQLELVVGDVERLPFDDASFDAVVCTLVMCSVPDAAAALREARRVLRPGGRLLILEHVAAEGEGAWLTRALQDALTPLQKLLGDGCHLNRTTGRTLAATPGWDASHLTTGRVPGLPGIFQQHVWGVVEAVQR